MNYRITSKHKTLIFIPTYNEQENVGPLFKEILDLDLDVEVLFMDDHSPDGTGQILDEMARNYPSIHVVHRECKKGIGLAHLDGIRWAYDQQYEVLITMDCDFTHSPQDIIRLLDHQDEYDIVVGSRYLSRRSLKGWNFLRKFLTNLGHFLTVLFLRMPYDATGAFRLYRLDRIPRTAFDLVVSKGYSFFFESLYILYFNNFRIKEFSIILPPRVYGHSKMTYKEAFNSLRRLVRTFFLTLSNRKHYLLPPSREDMVEEKPDDPADGWDEYWSHKDHPRGKIYDSVAEFYRKFIIKRTLNHFIEKNFSPGSKLLHAGCGSGQVDMDLCQTQSITALDISAPALTMYQKTNGDFAETVQGSILSIPDNIDSFDGVYNLGVMEHFTEDEIQIILAEFRRVLKPGGKAVLFWPPEFGLSVNFLKFVHFILNNILKKEIKLHPDEITRVRSRRHVQELVERAGFQFEDYYFGLRDLFTHSIIVAKKI